MHVTGADTYMRTSKHARAVEARTQRGSFWPTDSYILSYSVLSYSVLFYSILFFSILFYSTMISEMHTCRWPNERKMPVVHAGPDHPGVMATAVTAHIRPELLMVAMLAPSKAIEAT